MSRDNRRYFAHIPNTIIKNQKIHYKLNPKILFYKLKRNPNIDKYRCIQSLYLTIIPLLYSNRRNVSKCIH